MKSTVVGRLSAVEESLTDLVKLPAGAGEDQESLKRELRVELLRELDVRTSTGPGRGGALRASAPPFMPSSGMNPTQNDGRESDILADRLPDRPRVGGGGASEGGDLEFATSGGEARSQASATATPGGGVAGNSGQHRSMGSWPGMPIELSLSYWPRSTGGQMQRRLLTWPLT